MECLTLTSGSVEETARLATRLEPFLERGDVIALIGELGAGKTTFTQRLAQALGVKEQVNSPTFTLIKEYQGRLPLYHMDLYRLEDIGEAEALGLDDYFYGDGVCVIEWPDRLGALLPEDALFIEIAVIAPTSRRIQLRAKKGRGCERVKELSQSEMADD